MFWNMTLAMLLEGQVQFPAKNKRNLELHQTKANFLIISERDPESTKGQ